jgi:hypothetical protein
MRNKSIRCTHSRSLAVPLRLAPCIFFTHRASIILTLLILMVPGWLNASVIRVRAVAFTDVPGQHNADDTGRIEATDASASAVFSGSFLTPAGTSSSGDAMAHAAATLGALSVYSAAATNDFAYSFSAVDANASAEFRDLLMVSSSTVPAGTPVSLRFTLWFAGFVTASGGAVNGQNTSEYSVSSTLSFGSGLSAVGVNFSGRDLTPATPVSESRSVTIGANVGDTLVLDGFLQVHAWVAKGGTAVSDFGQTAHFYGDSLTPGVTLLGESGRDYTSPAPVPEPATPVLLGGGLLALLVFSHGCSQRGSAIAVLWRDVVRRSNSERLC